MIIRCLKKFGCSCKGSRKASRGSGLMVCDARGLPACILWPEPQNRTHTRKTLKHACIAPKSQCLEDSVGSCRPMQFIWN